jgi:hypothetical protein
MPNLLHDAQKNHQLASAIELLELSRGRAADDFGGIATGDESWFHYHYEPAKCLQRHEKREIFCSD